MSRKTVLVINDIRDCGASYFEPFRVFGRYETDHEILQHRPREVGLVVFCGGSDVSPEMYGDHKGPRCSYTDIDRDHFEKKIFNWAKGFGIPMAGICRGAQFLCAMSGGKIVQHIDGHGGSRHDVMTCDGETFNVNSLHHQMQYPYYMEKGTYKILAFAYPKISDVYSGGGFGSAFKCSKEPEAVYYKESNAVGIQWHPEILEEDDRAFRYVHDVCKKYLDLE